MLFKMASRGVGFKVLGKEFYVSQIFIDDLVEAIYQMALDASTNHRTYYTTHPEPVSQIELWQALGKACGKKVRVFSVPQPLFFTVDGYIQANTGYFLNGVQIAKPKSLKREFVFLKTDMTTIPGKLRRDVSYRKEKYILEWEILTLIEVSEILSAISQNKKISFRVNEANLQIGEVNVWPFLKSLDYSQAGSDYRASAVLELIEEII